MTSGIHKKKLALYSVVGPKETNVMIVIPSMHMIKLTLSSAASSKMTNILAIVPSMNSTLLEYVSFLHQSILHYECN